MTNSSDTRSGPANNNFRHGHTWKSGHSPTYASWQAMIQRVTNPNSDNYPRYAGRGISVCESWRAFTGFLADMGERPDGTTLDRIDNDGNYEPGNCRWATPAEQAANRTSAWDNPTTGRKHLLDNERCRNGHVLAEVGVYIKGQTAPLCKACAKDSRDRYNARRRTALAGVA